jgi:hypothetical protein
MLENQSKINPERRKRTSTFPQFTCAEIAVILMVILVFLMAWSWFMLSQFIKYTAPLPPSQTPPASPSPDGSPGLGFLNPTRTNLPTTIPTITAIQVETLTPTPTEIPKHPTNSPPPPGPEDYGICRYTVVDGDAVLALGEILNLERWIIDLTECARLEGNETCINLYKNPNAEHPDWVNPGWVMDFHKVLADACQSQRINGIFLPETLPLILSPTP